MNQESKSRFGFTEKEMADAFLQLLQSTNGLPGIGTFDGVYSEISCRQGRPDFIALRNKNGFEPKRLSESIGIIGPAILAILKFNAPRTLHYLVRQSEFSEDSIRRSLRQLIASGHVECTETGSYLLGNAAAHLQTELWAFELKLDKPKRAVFQAQQSRVYANRAVIVVPPGQEKNYSTYRMALKRWGIGLATFDPVTGIFKIIRRCRNTRAVCPQHQIYALSQIGISLYPPENTSVLSSL